MILAQIGHPNNLQLEKFPEYEVHTQILPAIRVTVIITLEIFVILANKTKRNMAWVWLEMGQVMV